MLSKVSCSEEIMQRGVVSLNSNSSFLPDVPSAVIFVSFGASLVYSGVGIVTWTSGAFLVVIAHMSSIIGGLLFMKLAQIIEIGPPPEEERPPVGPITVTIGEDFTVEERITVSEELEKQRKYGGLQSPIGGGSS